MGTNDRFGLGEVEGFLGSDDCSPFLRPMKTAGNKRGDFTHAHHNMGGSLGITHKGVHVELFQYMKF